MSIVFAASIGSERRTDLIRRSWEEQELIVLLTCVLIDKSPLLTDQFAFRPTGSTTAALIFILHSVTNLLTTYPYVHVVALDFSKAFDTVKHDVLVSKMFADNLPDYLLNWVSSYLEGRGHRNRCVDLTSEIASINDSVVQGSALGPVSFLLYASDLHAKVPGNTMAKYADGSYFIVSSCNTNSLPSELKHISDWASANGLKLNAAKSAELLVCKKSFSCINCPPPLSGLARVSEMIVLGVTLTQDLSLSLFMYRLSYQKVIDLSTPFKPVRSPYRLAP